MTLEIATAINQAIDKAADTLRQTALAVWQYKETGHNEHRSADCLCGVLETNGFAVERGLAGLPTAFEGVYNPQGTRKVAFLAEYDALPDIGHGCGHNLIGAAALGAGIGLKAAAGRLDTAVHVFGTPAEETTGGKIDLLKAGCFNSMDYIIMFHPSMHNAVDGRSLAISAYRITYTGKPAHAAADPFNGVNALDGVVSLYQNLALWRQQLMPAFRVHCVIREGGGALNVIPARAVADVAIRASTASALQGMRDRLKAIAGAAAMATGTSFTMEPHMRTYLEMKQNPVLGRVYKDTAAAFGIQSFIYRQHTGSVDLGNVSHHIPCLHAYMAITDQPLPGHSPEFAEAARSPRALDVMVTTARIMALTAARCTEPELLREVKASLSTD